MRKQLEIYILILTLTILLPASSFSQPTSSPYSIFGLGIMEGKSIGPGKAMGGTGIAFQSDIYINPMNPASYSGLDSLVSVFEIGLFSKYTLFTSNKDDQSAFDANFKYVVMGFRVTPWLTTSFGFMPYSSIGYNITTKADVEGTNMQFNKRFSGEGGVNKTYLGASVQLTKNISAGANLEYLFGNITQIEASNDYDYVLKDITYLSNIHLSYGLNYHFSIKDWRARVGLIYGRSKKLTSMNEITITTNKEIEELKSKNRKFSIPATYGIGIAVEKNFFKAGIDYERNVWKDIKFDNPYLNTRNSERISFGFEFPSQGLNKGTNRMIFYRFGAQYQKTYLIIKKIPIDYYSVSLGAGLPLKGVLSAINISLELGQNGTTEKNLFGENFLALHLDMSLRDLWFIKRRYQ